MRITGAIGIALATAFSGAHGAEAPKTPGQVFGSASPSVVVMNALDPAGASAAQGSGVVIAHEVVVSNCHVFTSAHDATVTVGGETLPAALRHADTERDLCSFTVPDLRAPPARLGATASLNVGDRVYSIGAPRGFELTLSDGLVSSIRTIDGGHLLQITAPISPGSSGGGLFDSTGKLIGITTMQWKESQQLNFAVPVEWIDELPRRDSARRTRTRAGAAADVAAIKADVLEGGRIALNALGDELEASDPHYRTKVPLLLPKLREIRATLPPEQWVAATRRAYAAISVPQSHPWLLVGKSANTDREIDLRTIKWHANRAHFWLRSTHSVPEVVGDHNVKTELLLYVLDCDQRTLSFTESIHYGPSGNLIKSWNYTEAASLSAIVPDSVGWTMLTALCK